MLFVYSKFKGSHWQHYTPDKRMQILQALEKKFAKKFHRPVLPVLIYPENNWNCYGMFAISNNNQYLYINDILLYKHEYRFHALETIIHEGRHAYQYFIINKPKVNFFNFKAKQWQKNWKGYYSSTESPTIYTMQAIERDAQKYTIKILKSIAHKYKNEKAFYATLKANIDRYEQGEILAKKQFGIFYKHKINKAINEKQNKNSI